MSSKYNNSNRIVPNNKRNTTPIVTSQRSTCVATFFRWDKVDISKLNLIQANNEKILKGNTSTEGNLDIKENIVVVKNDIIRANIDKSKSSNAGQFSLTLKRGKEVSPGGIVTEKDINYLEVINPGDWVMIYIKKSGDVKVGSTKAEDGLKMLGIVENVRYVEIDDPATGRPRLEYIITGQDFGKVFDMNVFFNPLINQETAASLLGAKFLTDVANTIKGVDRPDTAKGFDILSPDNVIKKLTSFYLGSGQLDSTSVNEAWYIPRNLAVSFRPDLKNKRSASFVDILDTSKIGLHKYNNQTQPTISKLPGATFFKGLPATGTVWSILQYLQNSITNEMYTELVPDASGNLKPSLVLRQVPFSNRPNQETNPFSVAESQGTKLEQAVKESEKTYFTELPRLEIVSSDIKEKNIGKSDFERINHLLVVPKNDIIDNLDLAYQSAVNVPSIQRYGLRTFQAQTGYILDANRNALKLAQFYLQLMIDWFFLSHLLYNGTIIIDGTDEHIQIGTNLYIRDAKQLFHIEAVRHTFENSPDGKTVFTTTLSVTRGQYFSNNTSKFIGPIQDQPISISTSARDGVR